MAKPTKKAAGRRAAILRAAQARSAAKVLPEASTPVTAHDVWKFENSEDVQASNALVGSGIADTLESCAWVLALLSEFHCRKPASELSDSVEAGMVLVIDWVLDAVEKQSKQLEVDHHG